MFKSRSVRSFRFYLWTVFFCVIFSFVIIGCGNNSNPGSPGNDTPGNDTPGSHLNYGGQMYRTVEIGGKTWMAQNLNYQPPAGNSWCYANADSNCTKYGRLYDWNTAMSACPAGWKLPNNADWDNLMAAVGGAATAGTKLKSKTGWNTGGSYIAGTDEYGFSALPGGYRWNDGSFDHVGNYGFWWSATEFTTEFDVSNANAYVRSMGYLMENVHTLWLGNKDRGYSVRCLMN